MLPADCLRVVAGGVGSVSKMLLRLVQLFWGQLKIRRLTVQLCLRWNSFRLASACPRLHSPTRRIRVFIHHIKHPKTSSPLHLVVREVIHMK